MRLAVIGAGFVGTTTAVAFTESGHDVRLVEPDPVRREQLVAGQVPFQEEGLETALGTALLQERLHVAEQLDPDEPAEIIYITVGTPPRADGSVDLGKVEAAAEQIGRVLAATARSAVVVVKSTVPPGTTRTVIGPIIDAHAQGVPYGLVMCPDFLGKGSALEDARRPSRIVIGASDKEAADTMRRLHRGTSGPVLITDPDTAEFITYASNAFLATKIAFANDMANLAEALGLDIDEVTPAVGLDPRIGPRFLDAGLGFGGDRLPKDLAALHALASTRGTPSRLLRAVLEQNSEQPLRAVRLAEEALGPLQGRRIALLGLAFKPQTAEVYETRALPIYRALRQAGADVVCYDPVAGEAFAALAGDHPTLARSAEEAVGGADAAIVQIAWPEFADLDPVDLKQAMRIPVVIDGRRVLDADRYRAAGIDYRAIGDGRGRPREGDKPRRAAPKGPPVGDERRTRPDAPPTGPAGHTIRR